MGVMLKFIAGATAASLALGGARAAAQPAPADMQPQLQVLRFAGSLEIEAPNRKESVPGENLPYIRSGSIVRVLSGAAVFRSDLRATVSAGKGDAFYFAAFKAEAGRPGYQRIAAIETEPTALEVAVGGEQFRLRKGGGLSVTATGPGEVTVKSEWGSVKIASGGRTMASGEALVIPVPEGSRFESPEMSLSGVRVTRKNETTFTAQGGASAVAQWPEASKAVAEAMLEKYGPPDKIDADRISWIDNGGWKKTTVHRVAREGEGVLEQTIGYDVPQDKRSDLSKLDITLKVNQVDKALSAASESEETNFLALNLADEVIRGKRTPEDARAFYRTTVRLSVSGKSSPYMRGLRFRR